MENDYLTVHILACFVLVLILILKLVSGVQVTFFADSNMCITEDNSTILHDSTLVSTKVYLTSLELYKL